MARGGRVGGVEYAERVNAAAELVAAGVSVAEAARVLAGRFGGLGASGPPLCGGRGPVGNGRWCPRRAMVFTVKVPAGVGAAGACACARESGTIDLRRGDPGAGRSFSRGAAETVPAGERAGWSRLCSSSTAWGPRNCRRPTRILVPEAAGPQRAGRSGRTAAAMTSAAIYARVSSARQKEEETIVSQTEALRAHARQLGLDVPQEWVFEDEGHSGRVAGAPGPGGAAGPGGPGAAWTWCWCYSPDRLARKFAYQALLLEELARAGRCGEFVKAPARRHPRGRSCWSSSRACSPSTRRRS